MDLSLIESICNKDERLISKKEAYTVYKIIYSDLADLTIASKIEIKLKKENEYILEKLDINKKHPLVQKKIINYTELDGVPLALKGRSYSVFSSNISRFLKEGVNSNILLETTSDMLINQIAKANAGVGVSLSFIAERFNSSDTVIRNFNDENCTKEVYLISKKGITKSKKNICFLSYLSEWLLTE